MRSGGIPASCSEKEMRMEGPAMCITLQSTGEVTDKEMLVGGILGKDGKPVKIKVEAPKTIQKLLQMEKRNKSRKKKAKVKRVEKRSQNGRINEQDGVEQENDGLGSRVSLTEVASDSSSSDEDLIDLPDIFKQQILQQKSECTSRKYKSEFQGEEFESSKREDSIYSGSSSIFDLTSDSEDEAFSHNDGANFTQNKRHTHANHHSKSLEKSQQMTLSKKPSGESSQQSWSKINTREPCSSMNSDNEASLCLSGPQRNSKSHHNKRKCKATSSDEHLPSTSGAESKAWGETSMASKPTRTRKSDFSLNIISSSKSLFSQASSSSSIEHDVHLPDPVSSGSSLVGVKSSEGKKKEYNRQRRSKSNDQPVRGKRNEAKNNGRKGSTIHLPSLLDKTDSHGSITHHRGPSSSKATHKESWHRGVTGGSEATPYLPRLSKQRTSLVQQTVSGEWDTHDSSKHSERTSSGKNKEQKGYKSQDKNRSKSSINKLTDQSALGATQSHAMTAVPDSRDNNNVAQSQSEHYTNNNTATPHKSALSPTHQTTVNNSSIVDVNNMQRTQSTQIKKQTRRISNATVRDVLLPNHKNTDSRGNQMRIRRKSKWGEDMSQVQASNSSHIGSSFVQMPNQNSSASNTNIQRLTSFQDDIPRRFGQKLVKKSKKSESERKESRIYNSKDLGNVVGNSGGDNVEHDGSTADGTARQKIRNNSSIQFDSGDGSSKQSLAARILKRTQGQHSDNSNVPMPITGRGGSSSQQTRPTSTGLGSRIVSNPVSNLLQDSTNTPQAMVRLKPLDPVTKVITSEEEPVPPRVDEATEPLTVENQTCDPEDQEDKESVDSGLDIISEESEEEEDSDDGLDFDIRPIPELKEISPMSFTSAYAYSFYKLSGPYKKAYDKTHARTLQPLRVGRKRRPPKVRRKKAK